MVEQQANVPKDLVLKVPIKYNGIQREVFVTIPLSGGLEISCDDDPHSADRLTAVIDGLSSSDARRKFLTEHTKVDKKIYTNSVLAVVPSGYALLPIKPQDPMYSQMQ